MKIQDLKNRKILILGWGKEGHAAEVYLRKHLPGAHIEHTDQSLDPDYLDRQKEFDLVVKSPGIPKRLVTIPYTTATNLFLANCSNMVIGVTGSKGKSTTSSLIHHILGEAGIKSRLVGNIGVPAIGALSDDIGRDDVFVMELSSYQLDDIAYSPHISLILNLFPEHMNYHGSPDLYYGAKRNILRYATEADYYVYNPQYPLLARWAQESVCKKVPYGKSFASLAGTRLIGAHNLDNMNAAVAVAGILDIPENTVKMALKSFRPLAHRLERVGEYKGIVFYDDAISTTPQSAIAALEALDRVETLFLGGQDRGYDFSELVREVERRNVKNIVLFPDSGKKIGELLRARKGYRPEILETEDMREAVEFAFRQTGRGGVCLLSTASPSYSIWKNFEEKGDLYQKWIKTHEEN